MFCPTCHADVPADAAFCPKCGQRLAGAATPPVASGAAGSPTTGGTAGLPSSAPAVAPPSAVERLRGGQHAIPHEEEKELWKGSYSPKAMYGAWVFAAAITIAGIVLAVLVPNPAAWIAAVIAIPVIWIGVLATLLYRRLCVDYTLTTQRFLHKRGLLRRVANQILLVDIDDVAYEQGLMDRFVNVGTITLHSNDPSDPVLPLRGIENVEEVANRIDEARREERRKRAIYMANA